MLLLFSSVVRWRSMLVRLAEANKMGSYSAASAAASDAPMATESRP